MFEPKIVCFLCKWCTSAGADLAGTSRLKYRPNGVNIRFMCSSRVDPEHILWAFHEGADGVLIGGCHPGDCHYMRGNLSTKRRVTGLSPFLKVIGIGDRLRLEWVGASEGSEMAETVRSFTKTIKQLGPSPFRKMKRDGTPGESSVQDYRLQALDVEM